MHEPLTYSTAYSTFSQEEKETIYQVVQEGFYSMGARVKQFEEDFAMFFGKQHAIMVNSGSSANLIATASLFYRSRNNLKAGDEVIVPNISWATTYYPLHQYGLKLKFVDVDPHTFNIDVNELKKAITAKTKLVMVVSILGNPCHLPEIKALCEERNVILFEDNCESMGAKINGQYTGTFGLVNTFSTFFSHHISTTEGGLILTDDDEVNCLCRSLRNHGWTRDQPENSSLYNKRDDDFFEAYRFILPGYNVRPTEIQGALGSVQLKKLPGFLKIRRENAQYFKQIFGGDKRFYIQKEVGNSSWFAFVIILHQKYKEKRKKLFAALKESGIDFRMVTGGSILEHDVARYFEKEVTKTNNAQYIHYNGFFVGNAPVNLKPQLDHLKKTIDSVL